MITSGPFGFSPFIGKVTTRTSTRAADWVISAETSPTSTTITKIYLDFNLTSGSPNVLFFTATSDLGSIAAVTSLMTAVNGINIYTVSLAISTGQYLGAFHTAGGTTNGFGHSSSGSSVGWAYNTGPTEQPAAGSNTPASRVGVSSPGNLILAAS